MSKTVLTVDDSRVMRDLLKSTLSEAGYEVLSAVDGEDGLEVASRSKFDAIITDINMPKMDGFQFMEALRLDDRFKGKPILVLTTEASPEKKDRARRAGATGWIVKPFDQEKLISALRRVVG